MHCVVFFTFGCENGLHEWTFWLVGFISRDLRFSLDSISIDMTRACVSFSMRDDFMRVSCVLYGIYV